MRIPTIDDLIRLPEEQAVDRRFDAWNFRVLRGVLAVLTPAAFVATMESITTGKPFLASLWALELLAILALFLTRKSRFFEESFRQIFISFYLFQFLVFLLVAPDPDVRLALAGFAFPVSLLLFRLRWSQYFLLLGVFLVTTVWLLIRTGVSEGTGDRIGVAVGVAVLTPVLLLILRRLNRGLRERFLTLWRRERSRDQEQSRMRDELQDARQIQLSMLPMEAPKLSWLDLSSVSLPASEVGGDYFDYVLLSESQLALVVGDVAGHGMSSGLLLAAVRGGLHLLKEDLASPMGVLEKLDRMVEEVAPRRMYVTLQIALVDHAERKLTVVSAGHPPAVFYSALDGATREVGTAATPLGTHLKTELQGQAAPIGSGDVLVLYTDGLLEAADFHGNSYGDERLTAAISHLSPDNSARQIRDSVLESVTHFKGDVELQDDLTLVVAKVR
ncbi:MAG: PP2C family protein-serine/threonine phosphatase [Thermoanaerobaculia bacterium]